MDFGWYLDGLGPVTRTAATRCPFPIPPRRPASARSRTKNGSAADFAVACGHEELVECLLEMAEVEWEHEAYFRAKVESHWLRHVIRVWPAIPPKSTIRTDFARRNAGYEAPALEPVAV